MADTKITALTAISTVDPAVDVFPIVDVSDTTMAASGTTKKITSNQLLGAGGTATLASATITGDLTVRTNKLAVTASGVGFGTTSPSAPIQVGDATGSPEIRLSGASTAAAGPYLTLYKGGSRKTLIGNEAVLIGSGTSDALMFYTEGGNGIKWNIGSSTPSMTLDSSGHLGLGVTPSAWATTFNVKAFQTAGGSLFNFSNTGIFLTQNSFYNTSGGYSYANNGFASEYYQMDGKHIWRTAASGTAGNAITFTQAMTLDASGNLLVGDTSSQIVGVRASIMGSGGFSVQYTGSTGTYLHIVPNAANGTVDIKADARTGNYPDLTIQTTGTQRVRVKATGQVRFVPLAADPAGAEAGDVYYNSTSNKLKCYNGTSWNDLF